MPTTPTYPGLYVTESTGVRAITGVDTTICAFVGAAATGPVNEPTPCSSFAEFERVFGGLSAPLPLGYAVRDFYSNGGVKALIVRVGAHAAQAASISLPTEDDASALTDADMAGDRELKTGLHALLRADLFNLLCVPPKRRGEGTSKALYQLALSLCVERRAMLIVDPDPAWGAPPERAVDNAVAGRNELSLLGEDARNAALYFPCLQQADPLRGNQMDTFVPCGAVAGVIARTDIERGVWKAPAGLEATLHGVQALQVNLSDHDNAQLNPLGVNCLRSFPASGHVVWGARTLRGADHWADTYKYVSVRRLALFIEESLIRGTQWAVFEPNEEPLWAQLRLAIGAFMQNLFRQGAFRGQTPREAYFVKCDSETTTQDDVNRGVVNLLVGFAPLKPAEFVIIKLQQLAGQVHA